MKKTLLIVGGVSLLSYALYRVWLNTVDSEVFQSFLEAQETVREHTLVRDGMREIF